MSFQHATLSAIPRPQTSLIGRAAETALIHDNLRRHGVRLLTLTGPGGAGKTRLAVHAALTVDGFPDGRWFVELAGLSDPALILPRIAQVLDVRERAAAFSGEQIVAALDQRDALLILDSFEHLLDGATAISQLLSRLDRLKILVTSRSPLRLAHEHVIQLGTLAVTQTGEGGHSEAAELFLQRCRAIRPKYDPSPADLRAIEDICAQLSGLPLGIELAAARIRVLAPQALLSRLAQPLHLLAAGPIDAPERHRSMRETIAWSYRLLDEDQRALLREMGVFAGSVPLDGIEVVSAAANIGAPGDTLDLLDRLADASMIEPYDRSGKSRYLLLDAVREFVLDELAERGELTAARERHAAWVEQLTARLLADFAGPREREAWARARAELDNLHAALGWSLAQGDIARVVRITGNLCDFWAFSGQSNEVKRWLDLVQRQLDSATLSPQERHRFWVAAGLVAWSQADPAGAVERYARSFEIASENGDRAAQAQSRMWQAMAVWYTGDYQEMHRLACESLALSTERTVFWADAQMLLGVAEMRMGRLDLAEAAFEIARAHFAAIGFTRVWIWSLQLLGDLAMLRGEPGVAARWHRESLALALQSSDRWGLFEDLSGLVAIALRLGWTEEAWELLASAELLATTTSVVAREGSLLSDENRTRLKAALAPDDLQRLAQQAATQSLPELVTRATEIARAMETGTPCVKRVAPERGAATRHRHPLELSPREQSVLALLVQGKTDRQISAELSISYGTARSHVAHVLHKLDARNRSVAVRKALELQLV